MSAICATIFPWLLEKVKGPTSEKQSDFLNCFWDQLAPVEGVKRSASGPKQADSV